MKLNEEIVVLVPYPKSRTLLNKPIILNVFEFTIPILTKVTI